MFAPHSSSQEAATTSAAVVDETNRIVPSDLAKLPFNNPEWASLVFAYVWARKDLIGRIVDAMGELSFYYVENLCWVKQEVNNTFSTQPSPYIRTTHETLLIFRRGVPKKLGVIAWKPVEMRHQRTEDVVFDFVRPLPGTEGNEMGGGGEESRPDQFCYDMVERMLPHAVHEEEEGQEGKISSRGANPIGESRLGKTKELRSLRSRGQLIHLWSEDCRRTGWTMLHQKSS